MNCNAVHNNLIFYLDNELNQEEKQELEKHLETCEECNNLYNQIAATYTFENIPEVSADFTDNVMQKIVPSRKVDFNKQQFIKFSRRIAAAILFMLISVSAVYIFTQQQQERYAQQQDAEEEIRNYYFADLDSYDLNTYYTSNTEEEE
ncbi:MAG: zf-HC2 domain-containing protein [Bacteroidales bacterium]|nr:zf-HC2 domain-containing protein [Bacteroidales bacterium]MCF8327700.1 zf-HC2 domain-containing protein [Bacteroidales bacterium]